MSADVSSKVYRPERTSRRGEFTAWVLALVIVGTLVIVWWGSGRVPLLGVALGLLFLLAASSITLSNWMDRKTVLVIQPSALAFQNGLRNVKLSWEDIIRVEIQPSSWGDKVYVYGNNQQFSFRKLHEVRVDGEVRGRMGFVGGDRILESILQYCDLKRIERQEDGVHYVRE